MSTPASIGRLLRSRGTTPGAGRAVVVVLCSMTGPIRVARRLFAAAQAPRHVRRRPSAERREPTLNPPTQSSIDASVRYLYEVGQLKLSKRTGWWHAGVPDPESVAEHTFRTAIIGYVLAVLEDADP